jgi:hypothetical protein
MFYTDQRHVDLPVLNRKSSYETVVIDVNHCTYQTNDDSIFIYRSYMTHRV